MIDQNQLSLDFLLTLHERYAHLTDLKLNLCDGYLYSTSALYRNNRDVALALGCQYSFDDSINYRTYWLVSLPELLKFKKIPFNDNVSRLKDLVAVRPNRFTFEEALHTCKNNLVFHEANHIICDAIFNKTFFEKIKFKDEAKKEVLRLQMQEAFAVTQDIFGQVFSQTPLAKFLWGFTTDQLMLEALHSDHMTKPVIDLIGYQGAHNLTTIFFLGAALLHTGFDRATYRRILDLLFPGTKFKTKDLKMFQDIFIHATKHFSGASAYAGNLFFRFLFDEDRSVFDLSDFDFIRIFEKNPELLDCLHVLADLSEHGLSAISATKFIKEAEIRATPKKAG